MARILAVTDGGGELGRRVAANALRAGPKVRVLVLGDDAAPDLPDAELARISGYEDRSAFREALADVATLFLIPVRERPDRAEVQIAALDDAMAAGVGRIVYHSFTGADPKAGSRWPGITMPPNNTCVD